MTTGEVSRRASVDMLTRPYSHRRDAARTDVSGSPTGACRRRLAKSAPRNVRKQPGGCLSIMATYCYANTGSNLKG